MNKSINKINNLIKKKYKYQLLENGFSKEDIEIGKKVLQTRRITMAEHTKNFENAFAKKIGLNCHAGHGLTYNNVGAIVSIKDIIGSSKRSA